MLWLLAFVPVVFVAEQLVPDAPTALTLYLLPPRVA
jgi:hypothetical protein